MATITPAIHVRIEGDRKLTLAFLDWALRERISPLKNTSGATGPDFVSLTYPLHHGAAIEKFIIDNEGKPD
ncbi:hypothetical protein BABAJAGA_00450 [Brevundimonas phage vB_BgoS-BabaJaga]|nr:hypothetical protein BABAJAGA_00450 [Brevundimonas phage vB_BgoS-BabaJaga]